MRNFNSNVFAAATAVIILAACTATQQPAPPPNTLVAAKVAGAPNLAAGAGDPVWATARPLQVQLSGGMNFGGKGETTVTLKAVYSGDTLYMLVQYTDPTDSMRRGPYQKQADGSWKKLADPADKGGDDNVYYEDKWAMIWPINNSCQGLRHHGLRGRVPRRRRQAVRQQVHAQRRRNPRHVAHEGLAHGADGLRGRPVHGPHALRREDHSERRPQE